MAVHGLSVHGADDLGMGPEPAAEGEIPAAGQAEADAALAARPDRREDRSRRVDRIGWNPQGADEHVRAPTRNGHQSGQLPRIRPPARARSGPSGRAEEAVHRLVDRSVAAEREQHVVAFDGSLPGKLGGVTPIACLHHFQLDEGRQGPHDHVSAGRGRGGGARIDDQERSHAPRVAMPGGFHNMRERPATLAGAAAVQAAESLGVLAATVIALADTISGRPYQVSSGVALTLIGFGATIVLAAVTPRLPRVRRWSRTPALLTQLFCGIVAIYLIQGHR